MKVSVVINTYNSAATLRLGLPRLEEFEDVVVCDHGSTDATVNIAEQSGARVIDYRDSEYDDFKVRCFSLENARFDWVLLLGADELVTPELVAYIREFTENPGDFDGLEIPRRTYVNQKLLKSNYPDYQRRLYRRSRGRKPEGVRPALFFAGPFKSIAAAEREKALIRIKQRYSREDDDMAGRDARLEKIRSRKSEIPLSTLLFMPFGEFLKFYIGRGDILHGRDGFVHSTLLSYQTFRKLLEIHYDHRAGSFMKETQLEMGNLMDRRHSKGE